MCGEQPEDRVETYKTKWNDKRVLEDDLHAL